MNGNLDFDFDFEEQTRSDLLAEARYELPGVYGILGDSTASDEAQAATDAANRLLDQVDKAVAELGEHPDVLELKEKHFTEHGLSAPLRFKDLSKDHRFYWLRLPITLMPAENMPFNKLECAVEFNPGVAEGYLRPKAHMILPDRRFKQLLEISDSLELGIDENFEFKAAAEIPELQAVIASGKIKGSVDVKAAGKLGMVVGPFKYTWKKALLQHSPVGTEKVFWRLDGAEFFQEEDPNLVVVLQVHKDVQEVRIAAALQAYSQFNLAAAGLSDAVRFLRSQLTNFFRKGAPIRHPQVWNITSSL